MEGNRGLITILLDATAIEKVFFCLEILDCPQTLKGYNVTIVESFGVLTG
jgi:predicted flavoprotein YhiN